MSRQKSNSFQRGIRTFSEATRSSFESISYRLSRISGIHPRGWGIGEVKHVDGSEGDGCLRLGCPDEQKCCPGFWNDRGVPPIWPLSCLFDPRNKKLNNNKYARMFGNFGFKYFDKERKAFMGVALSVTILAMIFTAASLTTLNPNGHFLKITAWGIASYRYDDDDGNKIGQISYIGLRKFLIVTCSDADEAYYADWTKCSLNGVWWSAVKCESEDEDFYGFPCGPINECGKTSAKTQFGAIMTCVTLIFAMIGCLTRMRKVADTNFQKMIGCFPDTFGIITQALALATFAGGCYDDMPHRTTSDDRIHYTIGYGYWAFVVCWLAAIIRASVHYCTPVPGGGVGCRFEDMKFVVSDVKSRIQQTSFTDNFMYAHKNTQSSSQPQGTIQQQPFQPQPSPHQQSQIEFNHSYRKEFPSDMDQVESIIESNNEDDDGDDLLSAPPYSESSNKQLATDQVTVVNVTKL